MKANVSHVNLVLLYALYVIYKQIEVRTYPANANKGTMMKKANCLIVKNVHNSVKNGKKKTRNKQYSLFILLYSFTSDTCIECEDKLNRKLNEFSGQCECMKGFKENN